MSKRGNPFGTGEAAEVDRSRGGGVGEATRARHSMAVAAGQPPWPGHTGGVGKSPERCPWPAPHPFPSAGFFPASLLLRTAGWMIADRRPDRGQPSGWGFRPVKCCAASPPRPFPPDPGAIANRDGHHAQRADFRRIIFPFSGRLSGSDDLQGNNGNMGTSSVRQAESRASGVCEPVPTPSGGFGNMGTEMADPDAGKSARVWLPPAPSSR